MLGVALRLVQLPVHPDRPPLGQARRHDDQQAPDENEAAAEAVEGLVRAGPEVRAEPVADLADAVGDGDQRGLLAAGRGDDGRLPRELQVEAVVGARDEQEEAEVARADVHGRDEQRAADGAADDGQHDVPEGLLVAARGPGAGAGEGVGECVGRRLDEVGRELAEVEGVDDLEGMLDVSGAR